MDHPLEAFARDSNFFLHHRLIPDAAIGLVVGTIIGVAVGLWWGSTFLGVGCGLGSAIGAGTLFDLWSWNW